MTYQAGRGLPSGLGIGVELACQNVAARGNSCTMIVDRMVLDRRAGRILAEEKEQSCGWLRPR
jgi:2,3-bisphosphoglycerate-independent phosphoglycerate mutase